MRPKWIAVGIVSVVALVLLGSGAAPLIFSEIVYGCNLQKKMATADLDEVTEHNITQKYFEKYYNLSASTERSRSMEWGYGIVEYTSSHYEQHGAEGWSSANLKVTIDQCGIPQEFEFQCIDNTGNAWVSVNSKKDNLIEYLQNENCFVSEEIIENEN